MSLMRLRLCVCVWLHKLVCRLINEWNARNELKEMKRKEQTNDPLVNAVSRMSD